ncbi:hypothetical protein CN116_23380 [Sinorhizobium meliloti]|nr:hypothetical protein CN240_01665 [Sinorhizobium meliloti]RVG49019.1 hypothetical protein CN227_03460 [Sinorhizobium meliloti]RVM03837.1 hypothetical protein CN125_29260 [Sinorhizobium meliloti]RVM42541.1 hypothetical protein CN121_26495 [Sinorhizobium meliloti]RVM59157.1 hypothetical protein CN124_27795 [Sinorhizobium meliloti]
MTITASPMKADNPDPNWEIEAALAWHDEDAHATIATLLLDGKHLREQRALAEQFMKEQGHAVPCSATVRRFDEPSTTPGPCGADRPKVLRGRSRSRSQRGPRMAWPRRYKFRCQAISRGNGI